MNISLPKLNILCILTWFLAILITLPVSSRVKIASDDTNMCGTDWGFTNTNKSCKAVVNQNDLGNFKMTRQECEEFIESDGQEMLNIITMERLNECACPK